MREAQEESIHFTSCLGWEEMSCRRYCDADCKSVSLFIFSSSLSLLPNEQAETLWKHEANPVDGHEALPAQTRRQLPITLKTKAEVLGWLTHGLHALPPTPHMAQPHRSP